jgi:hypothetical protein
VLLRVRDATVEVAMQEWAQGARRLGELQLPPDRRRVVLAVVDEVVDELERRVGQVFTLRDLAVVYSESSEWVREVAQRTTEHVWAHDLSVVQDAAFARFARRAADFRDRE